METGLIKLMKENVLDFDNSGKFDEAKITRLTSMLEVYNKIPTAQIV